MELAMREAVMKELGLAKDAPQVIMHCDSFGGHIQRNMTKMQKGMHDSAGGRSERRRSEVALRVQGKFDPELKKLLTPEQLTRLRQINWQIKWQFDASNALFDPAVDTGDWKLLLNSKNNYAR